MNEFVVIKHHVSQSPHFLGLGADDPYLVYLSQVLKNVIFKFFLRSGDFIMGKSVFSLSSVFLKLVEDASK